MKKSQSEGSKKVFRGYEMKRSQGKGREAIENTPVKSPAKKMKRLKPDAEDMASEAEPALTEAKREFRLLLSKCSGVFTELFRERAAEDASLLIDLEHVLVEARSLETHLKEKKEHLRRSLAFISDKLG